MMPKVRVPVVQRRQSTRPAKGVSFPPFGVGEVEGELLSAVRDGRLFPGKGGRPCSGQQPADFGHSGLAHSEGELFPRPPGKR
jgi:hypothetical protein